MTKGSQNIAKATLGEVKGFQLWVKESEGFWSWGHYTTKIDS